MARQKMNKNQLVDDFCDLEEDQFPEVQKDSQLLPSAPVKLSILP